MIIASLGPYALRYVNGVTNMIPNKGQDVTHLRSSHQSQWPPRQDTSILLVAQPKSWIMLCKAANDFPNGHQGPDLGYTLVHPKIMQA